MALRLHEGATTVPVDRGAAGSGGGRWRRLGLFTLMVFAAGFAATAVAAWLVSLVG